MPNVNKAKLRKLSKLKAKEVSVVPKGANERPWHIIKNADGVPMQNANKTPSQDVSPQDDQAFLAWVKKADFAQAMAGPAAAGDIDPQTQQVAVALHRIMRQYREYLSRDMMDAIMDHVGLGADEGTDDLEVVADDADISDPNVEMAEPAEDDGEAQADLNDAEDVDQAANSESSIGQEAGAPSKGPAKSTSQTADAKVKQQTSPSLDDDKKKVKPVLKGGEANQADLLANLPKQTRDYFEQVVAKSAEAETKLQAMQAQHDAMVSIVKGLEDEKQISAIEADLRLHAPFCGLDVAETAKVIKSLRATDEKAAKSFVDSLKTMSNQHKVAKANGGNLYAAMGTSPHASGEANINTAEGGNAYDRWEAALEGIVQKSGGQKTKHDATAEFLKTEAGKQAYAELIQRRARG